MKGDHTAKLWWAREHLERFAAEVTAFGMEDPYVGAFEFEVDTGEWVARIMVATPLPAHWSLLIGDIVHNLRSALDNLAFALVSANVPTLSRPDRVQFPIFESEVEFVRKRARYIGGMDPAAQAVIERLQPYHRLDRKYRSLLAVLHDLSNVDKHRHILVTGAVGTLKNITIDGYAPLDPPEVTRKKTPVVHGAEVARIKIWGPPRPKMVMRAEFPFDVAFAHEWPAYGASVVGVLTGVHNHIRDHVFAPLDRFL